MTDQDQREWPTFGDILTELNSLGQLSATLAGGSLSSESSWARDTAAQITSSSNAPSLEFADTLVETEDALEDEDESDESVLLPDHLPPAEIDTTVLEDSPVSSPSTPIGPDNLDTSALEPLEPFDADSNPEEGHADIDSREGEETPVELDAAEFAPSTTLFDQDVAEAPSASFAGGIDPITGEIDWSGTEWDDDDDSGESVAHDGELHGGIVFPFTAALETTDSGVDTVPESPEPSFDSVATADAIEHDLQDLFDIDQVPKENDNVVPLHPSSDDHSDQVVGLDTAFEHDTDHEPLQQWVGIDPSEIGPKDPWAHMRPTDDESKTGFWATRSKFFGGDERKAKKKARAEAGPTDRMDRESPGTDDNGAESNPYPCPSCKARGQVDLEDSMGKRVHLSCESCGQVWAQAYDGGQGQRSA